MQKKWQKNKEEQPLPSQEGILANHMVLTVWKMHTPTQSQEPASPTSALRQPVFVARQFHTLLHRVLFPWSKFHSKLWEQLPPNGSHRRRNILRQAEWSTMIVCTATWRNSEGRSIQHAAPPRTRRPKHVLQPICRSLSSSLDFVARQEVLFLLERRWHHLSCSQSRARPLQTTGISRSMQSPFGPALETHVPALETQPRPADFRS